jgi:hypothetical protein
MKKIFLLLTLFIPLLASSQITQYTAFRMWAIDSFRVGDRWIRKITTNLNSSDSNSHNMLPTNRAVMDMIRSAGSGNGDSTINGVVVKKSDGFFMPNQSHYYNGQVLQFDYIDSNFKPQFVPLYSIDIWRGSGLKIFGHSLASPSTDPPTSTMHSTLLALTIGGPDSNLAVGGTGMHDQLKRINQEDHLRKRETQPLLLCIGIDNREDTTIYADRPVYHTAGIFAAVRSHRDTIVLPGGMTFTGTWTDFTQGLAAGSRTNGKITSTSGDHYQFQITGKSAFFTFFSHSPNVDATNYTDSVTVTVDGTYHSSHSMANIGIMGTSVPYMGVIFIHGLSDAAHNIRVINQRNKPMAVDFAGSLDEGKNIAPILCEYVSTVGNGYISGTGAWKKLRINRLNRDYNLFITNNLTRWGIPAVCVNPLDGFNPNEHTKDWLHPDSVGQRIFYNSIMKQIAVIKHPDTTRFWNIGGNTGTDPTVNKIGTNDNKDLVIVANGVTRARFYTNNNVGLMQYQSIISGASNSVLMGAGTLGANALFGISGGRAYIDAQDAMAVGSPECRANAIGSFAQGDSRTEQSAARSVAFIRSKTFGENSGAMGFGAISNAYMEIVVGPYNDTAGSYLHSKTAWVSTDPQFTVSAGDTAGGGSVTRTTIFNLLKNGKARLWKYGLGNFTGTPAYNLSVDAAGNVIETATGGITSINSQTGPAITLNTGTTGNDFNIAQASNTITFHLPSASATARGAVSTTTQTFAGAKTFTEQLTVNATTHAAKLRLQGNISSATEVGIGGIGLQTDGITFNDGGAARTVSNGNRFHFIGQPTVTATNAVTYSNFTATLGIVGAPIAGTNMTLTTPYALHANDVSYMEGVAMGLNEQNSSITLADPTINIYNGSGGDTWTLPALAANPGKVYYIKNAGGGDLTVQRAGSDNIYTTSSVTSFTIAAGASKKIVGGTSFWYVLD